MYPKRKEISEERGNYLANFDPLVGFVFEKREDEVYEWHKFVIELLADFILWCDQRNGDEAEIIRLQGVSWNENEGGIGMIWVNGEYIIHCKMHCFDGTDKSISPSSNYLPWYGIQFRDHTDQGPPLYNVNKVFVIADAFEKFLIERGLEATRDNMPCRK